MSLTYRHANAIVALASSMAGAHLGACVTRSDRCTSMVTTESSRRNRVAERELIEYLDELVDPTSIHPEGVDDFNAWQDLRTVCGLMKGMK